MRKIRLVEEKKKKENIRKDIEGKHQGKRRE